MRLNVLRRAGEPPPLLLLHGLTANAHNWDGLNFPRAVLAPDLRGRGLSPQPSTGYTLEDHARDLLELAVPEATVVGHSFGGLLGLYLAARHPSSVVELFMLDSAVGVTGPKTLAAVRPSLQRLERTYPSWEAYLAEMKASPMYAEGWPSAVESYYRADVEIQPDGVRCRTRPETIAQVLQAVQSEDWEALARQVRQPVTLLRARDGIVGEEQLAATRAAIPQLEVHAVPGNHFTMLYEPEVARLVCRTSGL